MEPDEFAEFIEQPAQLGLKTYLDEQLGDFNDELASTATPVEVVIDVPEEFRPIQDLLTVLGEKTLLDHHGYFQLLEQGDILMNLENPLESARSLNNLARGTTSLNSVYYRSLGQIVDYVIREDHESFDAIKQLLGIQWRRYHKYYQLVMDYPRFGHSEILYSDVRDQNGHIENFFEWQRGLAFLLPLDHHLETYWQGSPNPTVQYAFQVDPELIEEDEDPEVEGQEAEDRSVGPGDCMICWTGMINRKCGSCMQGYHQLCWDRSGKNSCPKCNFSIGDQGPLV
jgi:hypothetical protein